MIEDIAVEFATDELIDIGTKSVRNILKQKIPRMLSKVTIKNIGAKVAMKQLVKKTLKF